MKTSITLKRLYALILSAVILLSCLTGVTMPAGATDETVETMTTEATEPETTEPEATEAETTEPAVTETPAETEPLTVPEGTHTTDDGKWSFAAYGEGVQITAYHGTATDVYVPAKVETDGVKYPVIKLTDDLFADNDSLNSVTLGEGILEIGAKAFYDCDNLVCIVTNETLTTIGAEAFYSCDSFNSVILYDAVSTIGENAFAECPSLTVWCNESTAAHTYATENAIPFEILNPDATPETYIQDGITYYIMNGEAIAINFDESVIDVTIPSLIEGYPVTELRETFRDCTLESVSLPDTLQIIGEYTFYSCSGLSSVTIPDGVVFIKDYSFYDCSLKSVTIPNGAKVIGNYAFCSSSLTSIIIPDSVTSIGNCACKLY